MSFITPNANFDVRPEVNFPQIRRLTQFELDNLKEQHRRLTFFNDKTNEERKKQQEERLFINLSLIELFQNISKTIINIINDLLAINQDTKYEDIILIFIKRERLIYIGMVSIIIAISIWIIAAVD